MRLPEDARNAIENSHCVISSIDGLHSYPRGIQVVRPLPSDSWVIAAAPVGARRGGCSARFDESASAAAARRFLLFLSRYVFS